MGTRLALALVLATACGRVGFDAIGGDARPGSGDAPDAAPDAAPDSSVPSAIALVQAGPVVMATTNLMPTLPAPSTAGTLLVAALATNGVTGVGLPAGWTMAAQISTNGGCTAVIAYYEANPGGITGGTFTQIAGTPGDAQLTEWSGIAAPNSLDVTGTNTASSPIASQAVLTASATTAAGDLAIGTFCEDVNNPTYAAGAGWTQLGSYSNVSSSPSFEHDYQLAEPVGTAADVVTSSVAGKYGAVLATFRSQ